MNGPNAPRLPALYRYRTDTGVVHALVLNLTAGVARACWIDGGVDVHRIPSGELRRAEPLDPDQYPPHRVARQMLRVGKSLGITPRASSALRMFTARGVAA